MSPPISPMTNVYLPNAPTQHTNGLLQQQSQMSHCVLIVRNAPVNVTVNDVIKFFSGYGDVSYIRNLFLFLKSSIFI